MGLLQETLGGLSPGVGLCEQSAQHQPFPAQGSPRVSCRRRTSAVQSLQVRELTARLGQAQQGHGDLNFLGSGIPHCTFLQTKVEKGRWKQVLLVALLKPLLL